MDIKDIIRIQGKLFSQPDKGWILIREAQFSFVAVIFKYLFPLLFLSTIGGIIFMGEPFVELGFGPSEAFLITFGGSLASIIISSMALARIVPRFGGTSTPAEAIALISFAYSPVFLASIISVLHPVLQAINIAGLVFTVYLFFKGTAILQRVPAEKRVGYTFVSLMVLFGFRLLFSVLLATIAGVTLPATN